MTNSLPEATADEAPKAPEYGRPASIEDASNRYFIHPLSSLVVTVAKFLKVTPNFVSLLGLGCGLLAGYLYYHLPQQTYVLAAFGAMICWHILDGADGRLARETGQTSAFGRIIDGICDHLVFAAVYIALALHLMENGYSASIWWLVIGAGVSHAIQAAGYEERRQQFQRRLKGIERNTVEENLLVIEGKRSFWASFYDKAQKFVAGGKYGFDEKLSELRANGDLENHTVPLINKTASMVRAWGLLNANNRTALIFICAFLGEPIFYFAFELIILNIVLIALMIAEKHQEQKLTAEASALISR